MRHISKLLPEQANTAVICDQHKVRMIQAGPGLVCRKCAVESAEADRANEANEIAAGIKQKRLSAAQLPKLHKDSGFKNYKVNTGKQQITLNCLFSFVKELMANVPKNLILAGPTGTGKTHLSCAAAKVLIEHGKTARYITSEAVAQKVIESWSNTGENEKSVIAEFTNYDLLILDEYGLHDRDKRLEQVHKILYARYDAGMPTMLVSNMHVSELKKDLGDRLWSRFQQNMLEVLECNWADYRLGGVA